MDNLYCDIEEMNEVSAAIGECSKRITELYTEMREQTEISLLSVWTDDSKEAFISRLLSLSSNVLEYTMMYSYMINSISTFAKKLDEVDERYARKFGGEYSASKSFITRISELIKKVESKGFNELSILMYLSSGVIPIGTEWNGVLNFYRTITEPFYKKTENKYDFLKGIKDGNEVLDVLGLGSDTLSEALDTDLLKTIGYGLDAKEFGDALRNGDKDTILELGEKYVKKGLEEGVKYVGNTGGLEAKMYVSLGWNFVENFGEALNEYGDPTWAGAGRRLWHMTGHTLIESGVEVGWDIIEKVDGLVGYDINQVYEDLYGASGSDAFFVATKSVAKDISWYAGYQFEKAQDYLHNVGASWGDKIGNLFD